MKNDYQIGEVRISIPPTLLFSTLGKMEDVRKAVTMDVKRPGDLVYILGKTFRELGGSEWFAMNGAVGNGVPKVDATSAKALYEALHRAIAAGLVASCHDCSDGGLGVALAETAFAGGFGVAVDLQAVPAEGIVRNDEILFSESQSRFVATVHPEARSAFEAALAGCTIARIGKVIPEGVLRIESLGGKRIIEESLAALKAAWQKPLAFHGAG
jgi:phosphoribosylformylglycinamidine (FGAM) synthase-like enzyme